MRLYISTCTAFHTNKNLLLLFFKELCLNRNTPQLLTKKVEKSKPCQGNKIGN